MEGKIIKDWSKVDLNNAQHRRNVVGAYNHFLTVGEKNRELQEALIQKAQFFGSADEFPASTLSIIEKYHAVGDFDLGWQLLFDVLDFTNSNRNGFRISNVSSGLTFDEIPKGKRIDVKKMSGTDVTVNFKDYGAALGYHRNLIDDKEYWTLEDNAIEMRNQAMVKKAEVHYALIEGVTTADIAWQAKDPEAPTTGDLNAASRDANTINEACLNVLTDLKNESMAVTPQTQFMLLAPAALRPRISRALNLTQQAFQGSVAKQVYNVSPIYTLMLSDQTKYYVIAPKRKMKSGLRKALSLEEDRDILANTDIVAAWMRFGAAIGEEKQVRRCLTA